VRPTVENNAWLGEFESVPLDNSIALVDLVRRPELELGELLGRFFDDQLELDGSIITRLVRSLEVECKFSGYLARQAEEVEKLKRIEAEKIPDDFCYDSVPGLRIEHSQKLKAGRPASLGQAGRIPGITPSALSVLAVYLKRHREVQCGEAKRA
jgi:tRNA uridine 5-carboxymethylaminomethyl modification enzyme